MSSKILIVDDSAEFRKVIRGFLENQEAHWEINEAGSGEMAIAKALTLRPDLVLMDVWLPGMNGLQAAAKLYEEHVSADVIMVTMFDPNEFNKEGRIGNVRGFISKSEIYDTLIPMVQKYLKEKQG